MADLGERAMAFLGDRVPVADRPALQRMLRYFDRSSLFLATAEGTGEDLVLVLANEAERFRVPLEHLRGLDAGLRAGRPVDWEALERVR